MYKKTCLLRTLYIPMTVGGNAGVIYSLKLTIVIIRGNTIII